ncbi:MAG: tetratricopeptide repeat protein, partial [Nitrososphaerales archaeon]
MPSWDALANEIILLSSRAVIKISSAPQNRRNNMIYLNARSLVYRYHLGEVTDEERREIDEGLLADEDCMERMEEAENELIAAYAAGGLTRYMRERFEKHFLRSEERLEKLRLAELLWERAKTRVARFPDASNPFYSYFAGELNPDERLKIEERLSSDSDYKRREEVAERELIVAYTLEDAIGEERERFQPYFFSSPERIERLKFAEAMYEYYDYVNWSVAQKRESASVMRFDRLRRLLSSPVRGLTLHPLLTPRPLWQPLAAVLIVTLCVVVWMSFFYRSPLDQGLSAIAAAGRLFEARVSDSGYEMHPRTRGDNSLDYEQLFLNNAAYLIAGATVGKENKSAREYYALGRLYLASGDFSRAAGYFNFALEKDDRNAKFYNDLAVALMAKERQKSREESTGEDYGEAIEYLKRAIALDPSLLEAHFNLALCLEYQ